jgi:hypothetical protein
LPFDTPSGLLLLPLGEHRVGELPALARLDPAQSPLIHFPLQRLAAHVEHLERVLDGVLGLGLPAVWT